MNSPTPLSPRRHPRRLRRPLLGLLSLALAGQAFTADITLRVFAGGTAQRPDLLRHILDDYEAAHPGIRVEIQTGAATSELQRKYLSTVLNASDPSLDALQIDIVSPAQFAAAGWLEPLDSYFGAERDAYFASFSPVYQKVNRYRDQWVAIPFTTDALFLYYRTDLLAKYNLPVPTTWEELAQTAKAIVDGEHNAQLRGLSIQGAPIEGAVCTFLLPYWSQGREFLDANGRLTLDRSAALRSFALWRDLLARNILPANTAETKTGDTINDFAAGQLVFALNWGFAWTVFDQAPGTKVKGQVGVARIPRVAGGEHVTSLGGWQWSVSAFSRHKPETVALIRYLGSPEVELRLAREAGFLPSRPAAYTDPAYLAQLPWLAEAGPVILSGRSRPITPRYAEVSETLRNTTSAVLGGSLAPEEGVTQIEDRLRRVLR